MASPGEMTKAVAALLGVPEMTVMLHDRALAASGLRTKGGRGRSAAKMTPKDATHLLIGVAASSLVKDTSEIVAEFSALPSYDGSVQWKVDERKTELDSNPPPTWNLSGFPLPPLQALSAAHTFGDALMALILSGMDGSLRKALEAIPGRIIHERSFPNWWELEVTFYGPSPQAVISIRWSDYQEWHRYAFLPGKDDDLAKWAEEFNAKAPKGDLSQTRRFTARTIFGVAELLNS